MIDVADGNVRTGNRLRRLPSPPRRFDGAHGTLPAKRSPSERANYGAPARTAAGAALILRGVIDARAEIEKLVVGFQRRGSGTDAERRAAGHLADRLASMGREPTIEPAWVHPSHGLTHLLHAIAGVLASIVSIGNPVAGLVLAATAAASALGDLSGRLHLARRLTPSRATQNVVSSEHGAKAGTLVLVAHYDAGRASPILGPWERSRAWLERLTRRRIGPFEPLTWSLLLVLACALTRTAGATGTFVSALQFLPTVALIVSVAVFTDQALAGFAPGAGDNASGVATVLRLAERYGGRLEHFDLWVLLPGAGAGQSLGMRAWMRRHRRELDARRTLFISVDGVGAGTIRYATREGFSFTRAYHPSLVALCDQIALEDRLEGRYRAKPVVSRSPGDGLVARAAGYPAITISCREVAAAGASAPGDLAERIDDAALRRAYEFCSELIELIDERIGPDLGS
ncbi:MAG: hypothetical protein NVSMB25_14540 [Thermoleophilaceae bacterium]